MDLQNTYYIIGIIFMVVMLLLVIAILIAILVIKAKINRVHRMIDDKVNSVKNVTDKLAMVARTVQYFMRR